MNTNGCLEQLIRVNKLNEIVDSYNYVSENVKVPFKNNQLIIDRIGDLATPKFLVIGTNDNITIEEFIEKLGNIHFKMEIGGRTIIENKIKLYHNIISIKKLSNNFFGIDVLFEQLNSPIIMKVLKYHQVICKLELTNSEIIKESYMIIKYQYINNKYQDELTDDLIEIPIQLFQSHEETYVPTKYIRISLDFCFLSRGLLLETNFNNINKIIFLLEKYERFNYDRNMLELCSQKINDNLIYIPFDSIDFFNKNKLSFRCGLNFTKFEVSYLQIEFEKEVEHISVHSIYLNFLRYEGGMCILNYIT